MLVQIDITNTIAFPQYLVKTRVYPSAYLFICPKVVFVPNGAEKRLPVLHYNAIYISVHL